MPDWIDLIDQSDQTARPTATTLTTAAADIYTSTDIFIPRNVTAFAARFTTAFSVAPTTAAKWQLKTLAKDDSTLAVQAAITFNGSSQAVGDIVYADLVTDGRAFQVAPGQRIRVSATTAAVMPGGSAGGAAIPMIAWNRDSDNPLTGYAHISKVASTAT